MYMSFSENIFVFKNMMKKLICNPRQALHYMNPEKIHRAFYYMRHGGFKSASRILDDRLLMGSDLKLVLDLEKLPKGETEKDFPKIQFKSCDNPKVTVIIPVYNQFAYTYNCLKALEKFTGDIPCEILIADDCSTDLTRRITDIVTGINVVKTERNSGFLRNCNHAAKEAKGEYILFLNNDTQVQKNWLRPLTDLLDMHPDIGMTGSKIVCPNGWLQGCGGIVWKDGSVWNYGNQRNPALPEFSYVKECDYVSGASFVIRKKLWMQLGGFDERYAPAYYEDTDLAFRVREAGYKVVLQPKSVAVHYEGISNGTDIEKGVKAYQKKNLKKFFERWKDELEREHFENGENVFLARDRSQLKKKILVIDHKVPMYDKDAGARQVLMYVKLFLKMNLSVTFIPDNFVPDQPYTDDLEELGVEVLYGNYYHLYHDQWLKDNIRYYDYFMLNRPHISVKYMDLILANRKPESRVIYYGHDLNFLRERRKYELSGKKEDLESSKKWKKTEA